jgi:hypothetical protein
LTALFNYGWTGILFILVVFVVHKFHRPVLVWWWARIMKHHGATKREVRDYVVREAAKNNQDFLIELTKGGGTSTSEPDSASGFVSGGPVAPARPKRATKPANPTTPAKRTTTSKQAPKVQTPAKAQSATVTPLPEPRTGRHAKPDNEGSAEVRHLPGAKEDSPTGRHSVA